MSTRWTVRGGPETAPDVTVEAVMYSLRQRGLPALAEPTTQRRLVSLSDDQVREVATRLQKLKPEIARAWSPEGVRDLARSWKRVRHVEAPRGYYSGNFCRIG